MRCHCRAICCVLATTGCCQCTCHCYGSNRMRPPRRRGCVLWQQPNAAEFGSNRMRPKRCVILSSCRAEMGCVLAATECGQSNVLLVLAAHRSGLCFGSNQMRPRHCYQLLTLRCAVGCVLAATECGQSDVLSVLAAQKWLCFGSNRMRPKRCVISSCRAQKWAVFWQQSNAAKALLSVIDAALRSGLCFGSNQMRPKRCVISYCVISYCRAHRSVCVFGSNQMQPKRCVTSY